MAKVNYGYDAPGIMRNFLVSGLVTLITGTSMLALFSSFVIIIIGVLALFAGTVLTALGTCMFAYSVKGKYRVRDFMLSQVVWKGDEKVLDIGTGQGLLMNGAAKHLSSGKSTGIDIWSSKDLSGNTMQRALENAKLEGVLSKVEVLNEDATSMHFEDNTFDVILSQFCLHNIEDKKDQEEACYEIARVLKPGGTALIGDYIPTNFYAESLAKAGLKIISSKPYFALAYGPTWIVYANKDESVIASHIPI